MQRSPKLVTTELKKLEGRIERLKSEKKRLSKKLSAERKKLRYRINRIKNLKNYNESVMGSVPVSMLLINERLKVIYANENFYRKTRKSREAVVNSHIDEVFPYGFVRDMDLDSKIEKVIGTGGIETGTVSYRISTYDYQILPVLGENGRRKAVLLVLDDVTGERLLEERIREIERHLTNVVESANDLIISTDARGRILTCNSAAERILGHGIDELETKSFASLFYKKDRKDIREKLRELKKERHIPRIELGMPTKDGEEALISWEIGVMTDKGGKIVGLTGIGRDLTERKRLETQLVQTERMASLGRLSAGVAHEINNPLGIITTSAENLLNVEKKDEFKLRNLKRIKAQVERAATIVNNLLNFSRPKELDIKPVKVTEVLEGTLPLVEHQLTLDNISVIREFEPELPMAMGDSSQLQQVFMNMIQNAHQAMSEGGKLFIKVKPVPDEPFVEVVFSDTGVGIPEKYLKNIFDPFFTTREDRGRTGLGLFVSYGIIERHNGSIWAENNPEGEGASFFIRLPIYKEVREEKEEKKKVEE